VGERIFAFLAALVLAAGIAVAGWFVGDGFLRGRSADRFVTVKGVAEREVKADVALWPLRFVVTDDDLNRAQQRITESAAKVYEFLGRQGIDKAQAQLQGLEVVDLLTNQYGERSSTSRYIITQTIMVRSSEVDVVFNATQKVGDLVGAGVVLSSRGEFGGEGPTFLFTRLNDAKPEMIAEATASARVAAEQFAKDSGSALGTIRNASQGVFVILPRDQAPGVQEQQQLFKILRVVTTVEYFLGG
jgi:hypothetical protein